MKTKRDLIITLLVYIATIALGIAVMYGITALAVERLFPEVETEKYVEESVGIATDEAVVFEPITEPETETETTALETETEASPETTIETEIQLLNTPICKEISYNEVYNAENDDLMLLARLIQNEAGADICTDEHQRAVASVLMNHVASPYFPNTVYGCIFSGWVDNGNKDYGIGSVAQFYSLVPTERAIANAQYVLTYGSTVGDAIYQAEFIQGEIVAVFEYPDSGLSTTYICR